MERIKLQTSTKQKQTNLCKNLMKKTEGMLRRHFSRFEKKNQQQKQPIFSCEIRITFHSAFLMRSDLNS